MQNLIYTILLLGTISFFTVGCTDAIVAAAIEEVKEKFDEDDEVTTTQDTIKIATTSDKGFGFAWDKKDDVYKELYYRDDADTSREVIMVGSTPMIRSYTCTFESDDQTSVEYKCTGLGTPEFEDEKIGEVMLTFQKDTEYAFLAEDTITFHTLQYTNDALIVNAY